MRALRLAKVKLTYPSASAPALRDISFEVDEGEIVLLLGRNNAGKTTLCRLLNGLVPKSIPADLEGEVEVLGRDVRRTSVARLATFVGMVFQEPESQLFCMGVEEEVAFGPENLGLPREELAERVFWALEVVGLDGCRDRSPMSLSGGEKQRLAIAAALSMRPRVLVLDEPTYALDPAGRLALYDLLKVLRDEHRMTILMADRDGEEVSSLCDRVILLERGTVVADGPPGKVLSNEQALNMAGVSPPQVVSLSSLVSKGHPGRARPFSDVDQAEREIVSLYGEGGD